MCENHKINSTCVILMNNVGGPLRSIMWPTMIGWIIMMILFVAGIFVGVDYWVGIRCAGIGLTIIFIHISSSTLIGCLWLN